MKNVILKLIKKDCVNPNELVDYLTKEYKLELLVLFGSCSTNNAWQGSDIDIGFLTKERMMQNNIEKFILDIARLSKFDKVNAVDLYFDDEARLNKQKGEKYGKELTLLQYKIFATGKLLYERDSGLFEFCKQRTLLSSKFQNQDVDKLIVEEKLNFITTILEKINKIDNLSTKLHREINDSNANKNADKRVNEERAALIIFLEDALVSNALNAVAAAVKLNNFTLNRYYNTAIEARYESFIRLAEASNTTKEEKIKLEAVAETTMLNNFLSIDYYHGPWWAIGKTVRKIKELYPEYIEIVRRIIRL